MSSNAIIKISITVTRHLIGSLAQLWRQINLTINWCELGEKNSCMNRQRQSLQLHFGFRFEEIFLIIKGKDIKAGNNSLISAKNAEHRTTAWADA